MAYLINYSTVDSSGKLLLDSHIVRPKYNLNGVECTSKIRAIPCYVHPLPISILRRVVDIPKDRINVKNIDLSKFSYVYRKYEGTVMKIGNVQKLIAEEGLIEKAIAAYKLIETQEDMSNEAINDLLAPCRIMIYVDPDLTVTGLSSYIKAID